VEYLNSSAAETAASDLVQNSSKQLANLHRTSQSAVVRNLLSKLGDPSLEARIGAGVQVSGAIRLQNTITTSTTSIHIASTTSTAMTVIPRVLLILLLILLVLLH
jgi:hypothetical protein